MKKIIAVVSFFVAVVAVAFLAGCATRGFEHKTTTTYPDGRVVVEEIKAKVNSLCYDSTLGGFAWESSPSNTSVRVDKHGSTGGMSNVVAITEAAGKWADAIKATAEAAK